REVEVAAGDLVERLGEQGGVLRVLGELAVERSCPWKLDRERVTGETLRVRLAENRRGRNRLLLDGRQDRPLPGLLELLQLERRGFCRLARPCLFGTWPGRRRLDGAGVRAALQELEAMGRRLAGEIRSRASHLDERELERQA